jgi:hypothetical protein
VDAITAISRYDHKARAIGQDRRRFAGAAATVVAAAGTLSLLKVTDRVRMAEAVSRRAAITLVYSVLTSRHVGIFAFLD